MAKNLNVSMTFTADTSQAKKEMKSLQDQLSKLGSGIDFGKGIGKDFVKNTQEAQKSIAALQTSLRAAFNVDTGKLDFTRFSSTLKKSGYDLKQYSKILTDIGPEGEQAFMELTNAIAKSEVPIIRISDKLKSLGTTLANTARWQISSSVLHGFMGAIQSAYGYAQDLNRSLNDIRIVTGYSADEMARFAEQANKSAQALSTTTTAYTDAALIFYQQGLNDEEVQKRTDATIKMANVTGENAEHVSSYMTAIWNNFADGSKNLEYYADVMTKLGAATAASSEEIAEGMEKFAAVGETVGLSYEYAAAAVTTVIDKTRQSADIVGTSFKTIFARLEGLQLGETLEDGTTLNKYSKALATVGINIKDQNGELKDMDQILDEIGAKWETLNKDQQVALAQTVGGVRQYTQLIALLDNFGAFRENVQLGLNSEGTLQHQQDIYAESWEASIDRVRAAWEALYSDIIKDDFFIDLNKHLTGFLQGLDKFIDGLGGVQGLLAVIAPFMTQIFGGKIVEQAKNIGYSLYMIAGGRKRVINKRNSEFDALQEKGDKILENDPGAKAAYDSHIEYLKVRAKYEKDLTKEQLEQYDILQKMTEDQLKLNNLKKEDLEKTQRKTKYLTERAKDLGSKINERYELEETDRTDIKNISEGSSQRTRFIANLIYSSDEAEQMASMQNAQKLLKEDTTGAIKEYLKALSINPEELENLDFGKLGENISEEAKKQILEMYEKIIYDAGEELQSVDTKLAKKDVEKVADILSKKEIAEARKEQEIKIRTGSGIDEKIKEAGKALNGPKSAISTLDGLSREITRNKNALTKMIGTLDENGKVITENSKKYQDQKAAIEKAKEALNELREQENKNKEALKVWEQNVTDNNIDDAQEQIEAQQKVGMSKAKEDLTQGEQARNQAGASGTAAIEGIKKDGEAAIKAKRLGTSLASLGQIAVSTLGTMTSLHSAIAILGDESITTNQKIESIILTLPSLTMGISSVAGAVNKLLSQYKDAEVSIGAALGAFGVVAAAGFVVYELMQKAERKRQEAIQEEVDSLNESGQRLLELAKKQKEANEAANEAVEAYNDLTQSITDFNHLSQDQQTELAELAEKLGIENAQLYANAGAYDYLNGKIQERIDLLVEENKANAQKATTGVNKQIYAAATATGTQWVADIIKQQVDQGEGSKVLSYYDLYYDNEEKILIPELRIIEDELRKQGTSLEELLGTSDEAVETFQDSYIQQNIARDTQQVLENLGINKLSESSSVADVNKVRTALIKQYLDNSDITLDEEGIKKVVDDYLMNFSKTQITTSNLLTNSIEKEEVEDRRQIGYSRYRGDALEWFDKNVYNVIDGINEASHDAAEVEKEYKNNIKEVEKAYANLDTKQRHQLDLYLKEMPDEFLRTFKELNYDLDKTLESMQHEVSDFTAENFVAQVNTMQSAIDKLKFGDVKSEEDWIKDVFNGDERAYNNALKQGLLFKYDEQTIKLITDSKELLPDYMDSQARRGARQTAIGKTQEEQKWAEAGQEQAALAFNREKNRIKSTQGLVLPNEIINSEIASYRVIYTDFQGNTNFKTFNTLEEAQQFSEQIQNEKLAEWSKENIQYDFAGIIQDATTRRKDLESGSRISTADTMKQAAVLYSDDAVGRAKATNAALENTAKLYKLDAEEVKNYSKYLQENNKYLKDQEAEANLVAAENMHMEQSIASIMSKYDSWNKILKDGSKDSEEYSKAIGEINEAYQGLFNTEENIDVEFITDPENLELLGKAAENDLEAITDLQIKYAEYSADISNLSVENQTKIHEAFAELDDIKWDEIEIGMSIDVDPALQNLQEALLAAGYTEKEMSKIFNSLGFDMGEPIQEKIMQFVGMETVGNGPLTAVVPKYEEISVFRGFGSSKYLGTGKANQAVKQTGKDNSGKSKSTKEKDYEKERYYTITRQIQDATDAFNEYEKAKDRAAGKAKVGYIDFELENLKERQRLQKEYLKEIEDYYKQDQAKLNFFGATYDENGVLTNYDEIFDRLQQKYKDAVASGSEEAINAAQQDMDAFIAAANQFDKTNQLYQSEMIKKAELAREEIDKTIEKIDTTLTLKVEIDDRSLKLLEYQLGRIEGGAFTQGAQMANRQAQLKLQLDEQAATRQALDDLLKQNKLTENDLATKTPEELVALGIDDKVLDKMKEYADKLLEIQGNIDALEEAILGGALEAFEEFNAEFDYQSKIIEHQTKLLKSYKDIAELVYGNAGLDEGFMIDLMGTSQETMLARTAATRTKLEADKQALAKAREAFANYSGGDEKVQKQLEEDVRTMEETVMQGEEDLLSQTQENLQQAKEIFDRTLEAAKQDYLKAVGADDWSMTLFDRATKIDDQYLDDYEKIYHLAKLTRDVNNSIDDTPAFRGKERLREVTEEILELEKEGVKVSQYQVDALRAKYELRLAEIALEDSQNAKSTVRMARDNEGNWSYVYTSDADDVDKAKQNYEDKLYEYQKLNTDYVKKQQKTYMDLAREAGDAITQIADNSRLDPAVQDEMIAETEAYYAELMGITTSELELALGYNKDLYEKDWASYNKYTGYKISADQNYIDKFDETILGEITGLKSTQEAYQNWADALAGDGGFIPAVGNALDDLAEAQDRALKNLGTDLDDFAGHVGTAMTTATTETEKAKNAIEDNAKQMEDFFNSLVDAIKKLNGLRINDKRDDITNFVNNINLMVKAYNDLAEAKKKASDVPFNPDSVSSTGNGGGGSGGGGGGNEPNAGNETFNYKLLGTDSLYKQYYDLGYRSEIEYNGKLPSPKDYKISQYMLAIEGAKDNDARKKIYEDYLKHLTFVEKIAISSLIGSFDTGGYTGSWGDSGRLAFLHQKELVLNAQDTANMLQMTNMVRELSEYIDFQAAATNLGRVSTTIGSVSALAGGELNQNVHIEATFPNVSEAYEIEEALTSLVNRAAQYANRK